MNFDSVTLITRPRRFGKTLNMSMVEQFFSIDYAGLIYDSTCLRNSICLLKKISRSIPSFPQKQIHIYKELIENNAFYIDKTLFIKEWWENFDSVTLITRPRL